MAKKFSLLSAAYGLLDAASIASTAVYDFGATKLKVAGTTVETLISNAVAAGVANYLPLAGGTMAGAIAMAAQKITGLGTPTATTDAATKAYADLMVPLAGGTMSGDLAMGAHKITGVATPAATTDAANKAYADLMLPLTGGTMSGAIAMGTHAITGMANGALVQDAAALGQTGQAMLLGFGDILGTGYLVNTTYFVDPWMSAGPASNVANAELPRKIISPYAGKINKIYYCIPLNAITGAGALATFTLRKNGVATALTWAVDSTTTTSPIVVTTGTPLTIAAGDEISFSLFIANTVWTGTFTGLHISVPIVNI